MTKKDIEQVDIRGLFSALYKDKKPSMSEDKLWIVFKKQQEHRIRNLWLRKINVFLMETESRETKKAEPQKNKEGAFWDDK